MHTLGINAAYHDSSATLVRDGIVIAAAEEERFSRIKHGKRPVPFSTWELPFHAIDYCLQEGGIMLTELDHVAYAFDPWQQLAAQGIDRETAVLTLPLQPSAQLAASPAASSPAALDCASASASTAPSTAASATRPGRWPSPWEPLFLSSIVNAPRQLASGAPHHLRARFRAARHDGPYRWHFIDHHLAHEASAFLAAPFATCAVLAMDGRGEDAATSYGIHRDGAYRRLRQVNLPHSLGLLYEHLTAYLGFQHAGDEYKVMALAAFGSPTYAATFREILRYQGGGDYRVVQFDFAQLFGAARERGAPIRQVHRDIARSLQTVLQETVLQMVRWLQRESGERHLALAGGVALNCVLNAVLRDQGGFDAVWVQPAAGDAGTALGAALWVDARERMNPSLQPTLQSTLESTLESMSHPTGEAAVALAPRRWQMQHANLGPSYDDDMIEAALRHAGLTYRRMDDIADAAASLLADNRVLAWFQGRMEFGPRALGARSILASPRSADMQARLNRLKDREDFRPVAPAVLEEAAQDWFTGAGAADQAAPFMTFVFEVDPARAVRIPAVRHVDGTARVQTVNREQQPLFHALLSAFAARTGVPVLVNTSFNTRGEPIVCSPRDAIESFCSTPIDALAIGSFLLTKRTLCG